MLLRLIAVLCAIVACASAQVQVKGYYRKDGTYVQPHTRSGTPASKSATTGDATHKNTATTAAPSATSTQTSSYAATAPILGTLDGITVGMSKGEVAAKVGNPNVQSAAAWVYTNRGKVRFAAEKVTAVEPDGATTTTSAPAPATTKAAARETTTTSEKAINSTAVIEIQKRNVSNAQKNEVYREANIPKSEQKNYVIDHKVPLELGGSNDNTNLQPQPKAEAKVKDQWENYLARQLKAGKMSVSDAQAEVQKSHSGPPPR